MTDIKEVLLLWFIRVFDKKSVLDGFVNNEIKPNLQLAKELHKPIIRKFKKGKFILGLEIIFGALI